MTNPTDIAIQIELLELELRGGLPKRERLWSQHKIAELRTELDVWRKTQEMGR